MRTQSKKNDPFREILRERKHVIQRQRIKRHRSEQAATCQGAQSRSCLSTSKSDSVLTLAMISEMQKVYLLSDMSALPCECICVAKIIYSMDTWTHWIWGCFLIFPDISKRTKQKPDNWGLPMFWKSFVLFQVDTRTLFRLFLTTCLRGSCFKLLF